ncbi:MAG: inorganic phosphate transporter [Bacilli bacterium]|nr:inorganic phosphate transporter [Bacilli bacterium]
METILDFFRACNSHPWGYIAFIANLGVVFVNGWTDGPNAIATAVTTRAIRPKAAVIMCAIGNLLGVIVIGIFASFISKLVGGDVSQTIADLISWGNASTDQILCAITCGLLAIVVVSLVCTYFKFPSSQSNCLIGGISGAGLALIAIGCGSQLGITPWIKVIIGFVGSLVLGFILGYLITLLIQVICRKMNKGRTTRFFTRGQIVTSALMSFMHGIQDGAKFIGVFIIIAATLGASTGGNYTELLISLDGVWWIYVPVTIMMFVGTLMGGYGIIKTMGRGMAVLKKYQGFATDIAASLGLLAATIFGLPVSTGTVKSTAILGGGAARSFRRVKWKVAGKMIMWGFISFPFSALVGFLLVMIFVWTCH